MNSEKVYLSKIQDLEERNEKAKKNKKKAEMLINDLRIVYQKRREILEEICFYSKGTDAERNAMYTLENEEIEEYKNNMKWEEGLECCDEIVNETTKEQEVLEEDFIKWKTKQAEASDGKI